MPRPSRCARSLVFYCSLLCALGSVAARADEAAIGYVKTVSDEASVATGNAHVTALASTPVFLGSRLKTGN